MSPTRRTTITAFLSTAALVLLGRGPSYGQSAAPLLELTPACDDGDEPTLAQTEGPFFKPDAPLKHDLAVDVGKGERITIAGFVLDGQCRPVPKAIVQLWHADADGRYDTSGYKLRGYQLCDDAGRWRFSSIVPGLYIGRTRHYHVKVQRPFGRVLTTQLYFPGEQRNARDGLFDERLLLRLSDSSAGKLGRFDFVV